MAADADVLLVIDAPSRGPSPFLPSKLIDYLPLRKPILGSHAGDGATAGLLRTSRVVSWRLRTTSQPSSGAGGSRWAAGASGTLGVGPAFDSVAAEFDISRTTAGFSDVLTHAFDQRRSH